MNNTPLQNAYRRMDFDRELVFRFFACFSLLEYAIKKAYPPSSAQDGTRINKVDWTGFINAIDSKPAGTDSPELQRAHEYLKVYKPKGQVYKDKGQGLQPDWDDRSNTENGNLLISRHIRKVRDNLFHGGKTGYEYPRDTLLLTYSLMILEDWASKDERVLDEISKVR